MPYINPTGTITGETDADGHAYAFVVSMQEDSSLSSFSVVGKYRPIICSLQNEGTPESILRVSQDAKDGVIHGYDYGWVETWLQECWLLPDKMTLHATNNTIMRFDDGYGTTATKVMGSTTSYRPYAYEYNSLLGRSPVYTYVRPGKTFSGNLVEFSLGQWAPSSGGWTPSGNAGCFYLNIKKIAQWLNNNYSGTREVVRIVFDFIGLNNKSYNGQDSIGTFGLLETRELDGSFDYATDWCGTRGGSGISLGIWDSVVHGEYYTGNKFTLHCTIGKFNRFRDGYASASSATWYYMPIAYDDTESDGSRLPQRPCMRVSICLCAS